MKLAQFKKTVGDANPAKLVNNLGDFSTLVTVTSIIDNTDEWSPIMTPAVYEGQRLVKAAVDSGEVKPTGHIWLYMKDASGNRYKLQRFMKQSNTDEPSNSTVATVLFLNQINKEAEDFEDLIGKSFILTKKGEEITSSAYLPETGDGKVAPAMVEPKF